MLEKLCLFITLFRLIGGGILPPPWADPKLNPCATKPRGWQLIYWPKDGQCYKIFQIGYPCPDTMEIAVIHNKNTIKAECKCPPKTALYAKDNKCYDLFKNKPCQKNHYYGPDTNKTNNAKPNNNRYGICKLVETCSDPNLVFWHIDEKCYKKYTQGPCPKGQLLTIGSDGLAKCNCSDNEEMKKFYWAPKKLCYEHYTIGPCQEKGHLFLPDGKCDCHLKLPHYHNETEQCYELGTIGPCKQGHQFQIEKYSNKAMCQCKEEHIYWQNDEKCYRPFTQGPCPFGNMLINSTTCIPIPCSRGHLYFPEQKTCYRIGTQGPCLVGQVVTFDFRTRPSIDGISYNGICACIGSYKENSKCLKEKRSTKSCEVGMVNYQNQCYKFYSQGPCKIGEWLVPSKQEKIKISEREDRNSGKCDCKPGYIKISSGKENFFQCLPPVYNLANYLNKNFLFINTN